MTHTRRATAGVMAIIGALVTVLPMSAGPNDEQEIRDVIAHYRTAANRRDLQAVMQCYAATDELLVYDVSNAPFRGRAAVTQDWEHFISAMTAIDLQFRYIEVMVSPGGEFAFAHFIERASLTPKQGAQLVNDNLRTTQIFQKLDGRWLIVHEHKSKSRSE